jgi:hypothetical protein
MLRLALLALSLSIACGGDVIIPRTADTAAPSDSVVDTAFNSADTAVAIADTASDVADASYPYLGAVVAFEFVNPVTAAAPGFQATAVFAPYTVETLGGCTTTPLPPDAQTAGSCCTCTSEQGVADPGLPIAVPDAATVTLESAAGAALATLSAPTDQATPTESLAPNWWALNLPSNYPYVNSLAWAPGDVLTVTASGDQIHAFEGALQTSALLTGVTPSFATGMLTIDRSQVFTVTWTPTGATTDAVVLLFQQEINSTSAYTTASCYCAVDDAVGALNLSPSELAGFSPSEFDGGEARGSITLERLRFSLAHADNAVVDLVGVVGQTIDVAFK